MGEFGKLGVSAGITTFERKNYGKIGAEYTYQGDLNNNNNGYKLSANGDLLIGKNLGGSVGAYAGFEFGKLNCTQYNLGLMANYTKTGYQGKTTAEVTQVDSEHTQIKIDSELPHSQSLKTGLELGYSRNICCDDNRKLSFSLMGGAEFYSSAKMPDVKISEDGVAIAKRPQKLDAIGGFMGAKAEYSEVVNKKGQELFFTCKTLAGTKGALEGELGVGFRF